MKSIEEFAAALVDAVKGARDAEQRVKDAQQSITRAQTEAERIRNDAAKERAAGRAEIAADKAHAAKRLADIEDKHNKKLAAEKAEHDGYVSTARAQVDQASETLAGLQKEITTARATRDGLSTEIAKLRAAFADSAARL